MSLPGGHDTLPRLPPTAGAAPRGSSTPATSSRCRSDTPGSSRRRRAPAPAPPAWPAPLPVDRPPGPPASWPASPPPSPRSTAPAPPPDTPAPPAPAGRRCPPTPAPQPLPRHPAPQPSPAPSAAPLVLALSLSTKRTLLPARARPTHASVPPHPRAQHKDPRWITPPGASCSIPFPVSASRRQGLDRCGLF